MNPTNHFLRNFRPCFRLYPLALGLACAALIASPAPAGDAKKSAIEATPCAKQKFHGKGARARLQACLDDHQRKRLTEERLSREEIEAWRQEVRERCAQEPRSCANRRAQLEEKIEAGWRDRQSDSQGPD